jgi:hypothetical protein
MLQTVTPHTRLSHTLNEQHSHFTGVVRHPIPHPSTMYCMAKFCHVRMSVRLSTVGMGSAEHCTLNLYVYNVCPVLLEALQRVALQAVALQPRTLVVVGCTTRTLRARWA